MADVKPRARVDDPELLARFAELPSQIPYFNIYEIGDETISFDAWDGQPVTHHLSSNPRHDEAGNLMRVPEGLHKAFHDGPRKRHAAWQIRQWMNQQQIEYLIAERGEEWLDRKYPKEKP